MKIELKKIGKKEAIDLLEKNVSNRPVRKSQVAGYAQEMLNKNWVETGDTIKISKSGKLIDGQHRLLAVVKADVELNMLIAFDVEDSAFDVLDTGLGRTAGDVLNIAGHEKYYNILAASARLLIKYINDYSLNIKSGSIDHKVLSHTTNRDIKIFVEENFEHLFWCVEYASKTYHKSRLLSTSSIAFFLYVFSKKNYEESEIFMNQVLLGIGISENDPAYHMRSKLILTTTSNVKFSKRVIQGFMFKCWNAFRKNEELKLLRFNPNEKMPDLL